MSRLSPISPAFLSLSPGADNALITGTVLSPLGVVRDEFRLDGLEARDARLDATVVRVPFAGRTTLAPPPPRVGLASRDALTDRDDVGRAAL